MYIDTGVLMYIIYVSVGVGVYKGVEKVRSVLFLVCEYI